MYTDFSVRGFRGLGDLELDRLTLVTVITGQNGVGKSSLLEAMFLHGCGPTAGVTALTVLRPMRQLVAVTLQSDGHINPPWHPFFPVDRRQLDIALRATVDGRSQSVAISQERSSGDVLIAGPGTGGTASSALAAVGVRSSTLDGEVQQHRTTARVEAGSQVRLVTDPEAPAPWSAVRIVKGPGAVDIPEAFSELRRLGRDAALLDAVRAVDPRITGMELLVGDGGNALHARFGSGPAIPFTSLGDGVNSVLTYLLSMTATQGGLVLIDELEEGLHHSVFTDVWRALVSLARATGTQLIVTTHSDECIAGAARAMEGDLDLLTLVRLRRTDGDVEHDPARPVEGVTYPGEQVADAIDLSVEVR